MTHTIDTSVPAPAHRLPDVTMHVGIPCEALVLTLRGAVAAGALREGDRLITRSGSRRLRAITKERLRDVDVVVLGEGAMGHDRPEAPLHLPAGQRVVLRGWRAETLYGAPVVAVPAARIADGTLLRNARVAEIEVCHLGFDKTEVIYADGVELACVGAC